MASCYLDRASRTLYVACNFIEIPGSAITIPIDYLVYYAYYSILRRGALDITAPELGFSERDVKNTIKRISADIPRLSALSLKTKPIADCLSENKLSQSLERAYRGRRLLRARDRGGVPAVLPMPPSAPPTAPVLASSLLAAALAPPPDPDEVIDLEGSLCSLIAESATRIEFCPGKPVSHLWMSDVFSILAVMEHGSVSWHAGACTFILHTRDSLYYNVQHLCCWAFYKMDTSVDGLCEMARARHQTGQSAPRGAFPAPAPSLDRAGSSHFSSAASSGAPAMQAGAQAGVQGAAPAGQPLQSAQPAQSAQALRSVQSVQSVQSHLPAQSRNSSAAQQGGYSGARGQAPSLTASVISSRRSDAGSVVHSGPQRSRQNYSAAISTGAPGQGRPVAPAAPGELRPQPRAGNSLAHYEKKRVIVEAVRCLLEELIRLSGNRGISVYDVSAKVVRFCLQYSTSNSAVNIWRVYSLPFPFQTQLSDVLSGRDFVCAERSGERVIFVPPYGVWTLEDLEQETDNYPWGISLQEVLPQLRVSVTRERGQADEDFTTKMSEIARRARQQPSSLDPTSRVRYTPSGLTSSADIEIDKRLKELQDQHRICIMRHDGRAGTEERYIFKRSGQNFFFDLVSDQLNQGDDLLLAGDRPPDLRARERPSRAAPPLASGLSGLSSATSTVTRAGPPSAASAFQSPPASAEVVAREKARRALLLDAREVRERLCKRWCFLQDKEAAKITIGKELDIRPLRSREAATRKRKYNRSAGDWQNHHITAKWYEDAHNEQARKLNGGVE